MSLLSERIQKKTIKHYRLLFGAIQQRYKLYYGRKQIRKYGVWFIDIPRTSSASIKTELGLIYGPPYGKAKLISRQRWPYDLSRNNVAIMRKLKNRSDLIFGDHVPAIEMQKKIGKKLWGEIFTFTFVRNPWDRMLSLFFAMKKWGEIPGDMQFRDYILALKDDQKRSDRAIFRLPEYYLGSSDYVLDANGEILVNFIGKFENRSEDLKIVAHKIRFEQLGKLATKKSTKQNRHYSQYYDENTKAIIRKIYWKDIELFDYKFEK